MSVGVTKDYKLKVKNCPFFPPKKCLRSTRGSEQAERRGRYRVREGGEEISFLATVQQRNHVGRSTAYC
jgi:hypothetical protein